MKSVRYSTLLTIFYVFEYISSCKTVPPSPRPIQSNLTESFARFSTQALVPRLLRPPNSPRDADGPIPRHPRAARGVYKSSVILRDTCETESPNWFGHARCQWISATTLTILDGSRSHVERAPPKMANCMGGKEMGVLLLFHVLSACCVCIALIK